MSSAYASFFISSTLPTVTTSPQATPNTGSRERCSWVAGGHKAIKPPNKLISKQDQTGGTWTGTCVHCGWCHVTLELTRLKLSLPLSLSIVFLCARTRIYLCIPASAHANTQKETEHERKLSFCPSEPHLLRDFISPQLYKPILTHSVSDSKIHFHFF